jgi:hypothetical protein
MASTRRKMCEPFGAFCTLVHRFAQRTDDNLIDGNSLPDYLHFRLNREA